MKLLTIANRYYLLTLIVVFAIGSMIAYNVLKSILNHEFNQKLFAEQQQIVYELRNYDNLQRSYYLNIGDVIQLRQMPEDPHLIPALRDTIMYDQFEKKELPFRVLTFSDEIQGRFYTIMISKSLLPNLDLIEGVSEIMVGIALMLMLALGLLNRIIFRKLWSPFHQIILQLQKFQITNPVPLNVERTNVEEFNQLINVLDSMIQKSQTDYKNLKEYTENTSHEIQTPLAIIKNKAEILLQEPLEEVYLSELAKIYEAAGRLSRLKEGLSILTKIANNQYIESEPIRIKEFIIQKVEGFEELLDIKELEITTNFNSDPTLVLNNDLAYMMITNLISNSIKHNVQKGKIHISLGMNELLIENTGIEPTMPTEELFGRFKRSSPNNESTGLGLSLVKRIVDVYKMTITYTYADSWHRIRVVFPSSLMKH